MPYLFRHLELTRFDNPSLPVAQLEDVYSTRKTGKVHLVGEAYAGKFKNFFA